MKILSQRDPEWASVKLGQSNRTVASVGCVITAVSMSGDFFGEYKTPGVLAKALKFTQDALLYWTSIDTVYERLAFKTRFYGHQSVLIDEALKGADTTCLLNVDNGAHWVLGIRRLYGNTYWVADPWTGTRKTYSGVVGGAVLKRKVDAICKKCLIHNCPK